MRKMWPQECEDSLGVRMQRDYISSLYKVAGRKKRVRLYETPKPTCFFTSSSKALTPKGLTILLNITTNWGM